jgi:hypothetical protein
MCCRVVRMPGPKSSEFGGDPGQPFPEAGLGQEDMLRIMYQSDAMDPSAAAGVVSDRVK